MKQLTNAMRKISKVILPVFFLLLTNTVLAEGNFEAGKALFDANCSSCHSSNLTKDATGPALYGVGERVPGPANEWLNKWIKNNNTLRSSGDVYANGIYKKWGGAAMTAFEWMSDQQLENVIEYITKWELPAPAEGGGGLLPCIPEQKKEEDSYLIVLFGVIGLSLLIILIFTGVNRSLKNAVAVKKGEEVKDPVPFWTAIGEFAVHNKIKFGLIVLFVLGGISSLGWDSLMSVGVFGGNGFEKTENIENYHPDQPIYFRHDIHVAQNGIDCKYCHSGVLESKHALIPSANVCMNCHKYVNEKADCPESAQKIQKIYNAVKFTHGKGYYNLAENGDTIRNEEGDIVYHDQQVAKGDPIEWVKVHNLQDFVYFNHSQHVVVGGLECQQCHGPVQEMQTAEHYAPLTMGWCINCHRETEINQELKLSKKPNGYYEKMHDEFKEAYKRDEDFDFTVEKIGGLECAKCHY
ncbi:MAG: cytochrome C [Flavobacteriales bacterium]|nr:cytochrome C [Flavobacteriales bacterium]|tara:strand:+ start:14810 stop:16207 length:1398 start_codon:yes stop_codon:yes gene_type:complete